MKIDGARDLILAAVAAIPRGSVQSYGVVGERAGFARRARLVARVLATLPADSGIPWYRVVRAGNRIAFAPGSEDFQRQRRRLEAEGCKVGDNGLVRPVARALSLDAEIWGAFFEPEP
jgi:methylated-DNA-protein-cysteine methyltransferase-like protein